MNIEAFRAAVRDRALRPYEELVNTDRWSPATRRFAEEIMTLGWKSRRFPRLRLEPPVDWAGAAAAHRSWAFNLHSWDFLSPVLAGYEHTRDRRYLDWSLMLAGDWAHRYPEIATEAGMAWYDMAIGLRAYRLGYLVDAAARLAGTDDDTLDLLLDCAGLHLEALADEQFFAAHSNHGFYVAAGQSALARRLEGWPGIDKHRYQAHERVHRLIGTQFTEAGVHREHSPGYHMMVLDTFNGLMRSGLVSGAEFEDLAERIEEALAWFVMPDGRLAMFGDTCSTSVRGDMHKHVINDALRFAVSRGRTGKPPDDAWRWFADAGYFVARDGWPAGPDDYGDSSYLAQTAAFHSRVHKHADDLSMVWYDRGHEILVDPGRYGYLDRTTPASDLGKAGFYYAHPCRVYVESTRAHNTVEVDERSYQRRGVRPYGSALFRAGERGGVFYSGAHVRHNKTIRHARVLAYRPRAWLLVYDWLWDNLNEPHTFTQRFHFAPELDLAVARNGVEVLLPDDRLHVLPLLAAERVGPVRGQEDPELLGWISRADGEMEPCWTVAHRVAGAASGSMATLLAFGDAAPVPGPSTVTPRGEKVRFSWAVGGFVWEVGFGRPDRDDFHFDAHMSFAG